MAPQLLAMTCLSVPFMLCTGILAPATAATDDDDDKDDDGDDDDDDAANAALSVLSSIF